MKITNLFIENFKRITAAEFIPDDNMVILSGANAQGKTSVLDGIAAALGGGPVNRLIERPIRDGATEATVRLDLGDMIVTRKWKGDKSTLTVESADGAKYSSPQAILDGLVGKLAFDPLAFASTPAKDQLKTLLGLVELPFDLEELDGQRRRIFDERTNVNRSLKELDGQIAGHSAVGTDTPAEEVSVSALLTEYREGQAFNDRIDKADRAVIAWQAKVDRLKVELTEAQDALDNASDYSAKSPELVNLDAIQEQIDNAESINDQVRKRRAQGDIKAKRDATAIHAADFTAKLEAIDKTKADGLAGAKFPIEGLGFNEDGVTYNGVPFSQASSAERLRVSTAMGMALNPKLRVMHIRDASLLDSANMATLADMAKAGDFQLWVERVDETGTVGVVIEDGKVSA
jgi:hypothetical protein